MKLRSNTAWAQVMLLGLLLCGNPVARADSMPDEAHAEATDLAYTALPLQSAAGSMAPNLSRSADGTVILSWLETTDGQTRLQFSRLTDEAWSSPRTAAAGDNWFVNWADFPSVVAISETLWAAHWLQKVEGGTYAYHVKVALSEDAGESWGAAITPHRDNTPTEHGFVSLFPAPIAGQQGVGAIWLDGRNTGGSADGHADHEEHAGGGMTLRSAVILPDGEITAETEMDALVCDCCQTGVAIARQGPVAVYRNRSEAEIRDIYLARAVDHQWQAGHAVHDDGWKIAGCPVNGPAVGASGDTVVVAWFTMAEDTPRVRFGRSEDGGETFPQVLDIAEHSPQGRVDVALLKDGRAAITWLDEVVSGGVTSAVIRIQIIDNYGRLAASHSLSGLESGRAGGFPQMVADGQALILAWTVGVDEDTRVLSARVALPAANPPDAD